MKFFIIIRGPLGIGKTTIAEKLAKKLEAEHISVDRILDDYKLEKWENGYISEKSFLNANKIAISKAKGFLKKGVSVIFDGNFYYKSQIEDLIKKLRYKSHIFTLGASLETCTNRDSKRKNSYGKEAAEAVHKKVSEFDFGVVIDTENKSVEQVVKEILGELK